MRYLSVLVASLLCLTLTACDANTGAYPQVANPPPFDYADGDELRSRMHQLAFAIQRLDGALLNETDGGAPDQQSVIANLRHIERIGESLQTSDLNSKHPFLVDNMDRFLDDVKIAKQEALGNSYEMAGSIASACDSCHVENY